MAKSDMPMAVVAVLVVPALPRRDDKSSAVY